MTILLAVVIGRAVVADDDGGPLPSSVRIAHVPDTYRITYEVDQAGGPDQPRSVTTEVLEVDRPFRSLVATRAGKPPGGALVAGRISDLNRLLQFDGTSWRELAIAPAMAASDLRLDGVLDERVAAGDIERRGVRRVAGRPCQEYRMGGPPAGGSIPALGSKRGEHADVCVDRDGLVLDERWVADGDVLRRRTAVDVATGVHFPKETFTAEGATKVAATDGGGAAARVADDFTFGDRTWQLRAAPEGFHAAGRWSVVWPRLDTAVDPMGSDTAGRVAGLATVWVRGPDVIVIEQGGTHDGSTPFPSVEGAKAAPLGTLDGEAFTDARGTEVRATADDGSFVRVWSTLPRARVLALARDLRAT